MLPMYMPGRILTGSSPCKTCKVELFSPHLEQAMTICPATRADAAETWSIKPAWI